MTLWAGASATVITQLREWGLREIKNLPKCFGQGKPQNFRSAILLGEKEVGCSGFFGSESSLTLFYKQPTLIGLL